MMTLLLLEHLGEDRKIRGTESREGEEGGGRQEEKLTRKRQKQRRKPLACEKGRQTPLALRRAHPPPREGRAAGATVWVTHPSCLQVMDPFNPKTLLCNRSFGL